MKYLIRKILSTALPFLIMAVCGHGILVGFTPYHFYVIGISAIVLSMISCGKIIRRVIYFPINLMRKVLLRL